MKKNRQISPERKTLYYIGMTLGVIGILLFVSAFFSVVGNSGPFGSNTIRVEGVGGIEGYEITGVRVNDGPPSFVFRAFCGIGLVALGGVLMTVGSKGVAGSGIILDPEQTRRDFEPWSRAAGGMLKDGLDEVGIDIEEVLSSKAVDSNFGDKLRELHRLYEEGILSKEEYEREKREILDQI